MVLVFLGLILGVTAPAFVGAVGEKAPDDAALALLRSARTTALRQGVRVEVTVAPKARRAWIRARSATPALDSTVVLGTSDGTTYSSTRERVHFTVFADGSAWGGTLLVSTGGGASLLLLDRQSGEPTVRPAAAGASLR